ncbi:hypothetical protein Taro_028657, partial [Colocasia esculenta]|nr:hypothetical protein [Colocasia esculenta]
SLVRLRCAQTTPHTVAITSPPVNVPAAGASKAVQNTMSSAPPQRSYGPRGHAPRQAKRFVPRTENTAAPSSSSSISSSTSSSSSSRDRNPAPQNPRPRSLTASLRGAAPSSASSGPPSRGGGGGFVSYLPQDEALASGLGVESGGLDAVESQAVVDVLNGELSRLLKLKPREFWKEVASSDALHKSLDSYLQFRNRWYDFPHRGPRDTIAGIIIGEAELSRRVFMAFYRMSSNKEPGAHSGGCLNAKEHAAILQEKKLLGLPKLLDICAIYGHDNSDLTRALVTSAINAQPKLIDDVGAMLFHFLSIIHTMHQRCSSSVQVMDFINDAVVTLDTFVDAYKSAAVYLSHPVEMSLREELMKGFPGFFDSLSSQSILPPFLLIHGSEELLIVLARLHDSLIPKLQEGFACLSGNKEVRSKNSSHNDHANIVLSLKMLSMRIIKFGWKLLDICYLSDELLGINLNLETTTRIFPSKVEDPGIRGDILVQTFRELSNEVSFHIQGIKANLTFIQDIEKNCGVLGRIGNLQTKGWLYMDDEQLHYLTGLTTLPPHEARKKEPKMHVSSVDEMVQKDEDSVIMESKVSQIKDLFPDYGNGFLAACLEVYDHNPEEVIQRILEGTLHEDLLSLDMSLEQVPPPKSVSLIRNDKGKAVLESKLPSRSAKGKEVLLEPESHVHFLPSAVDHSVERRDSVHPPSTPLVSHGRYTRKTADELPDSEVLDSKSAKNSVRSAVLQAQYEDAYEDEYDDSFDELGLSVVESAFEAVETSRDKISSLPGKSASLEVESSKGSSTWRPQKQPQFYVKDGKNYGYKVSGSVAVRNVEEAELVRLSQKETIHGLGRGGNLPLGAVKNLMDAEEQANEDNDGADNAGQGHMNSRGRGRRGGSSKHHRKNRAIRKAFAGLTTS